MVSRDQGERPVDPPGRRAPAIVDGVNSEKSIAGSMSLPLREVRIRNSHCLFLRCTIQRSDLFPTVPKFLGSLDRLSVIL